MNDIKRRIKSVTSTKQITKAMELVATAKLKRARTKLEKSKPYYNRIYKSIREIVAFSKGIRHEFLEEREINKTLYIVLTGDRGLAGGYNSNICKLVESDVEDKSNVKLMCIGSKGRSYFLKRGYDVAYDMTGVSETPEYSNARVIGEKAIEMYRNKEVDEVKLVFTEFISTINYNPIVLDLLPLVIKEKEELDKEVKTDSGDETIIFRYEPSPEAVLNYLIPKYINSVIYGASIEASASEQGSRRVAMESATDNAEEMIDDLNLLYNRARQASITQEITEIVSGADALE
jgi:F-type H+-transporting ATPase subunit gamma